MHPAIPAAQKSAKTHKRIEERFHIIISPELSLESNVIYLNFENCRIYHRIRNKYEYIHPEEQFEKIIRPGWVPYFGVCNPAIALFLEWDGYRQEDMINNSVCFSDFA